MMETNKKYEAAVNGVNLWIYQGRDWSQTLQVDDNILKISCYVCSFYGSHLLGNSLRFEDQNYFWSVKNFAYVMLGICSFLLLARLILSEPVEIIGWFQESAGTDKEKSIPDTEESTKKVKLQNDDASSPVMTRQPISVPAIFEFDREPFQEKNKKAETKEKEVKEEVSQILNIQGEDIPNSIKEGLSDEITKNLASLANLNKKLESTYNFTSANTSNCEEGQTIQDSKQQDKRNRGDAFQCIGNLNHTLNSVDSQQQYHEQKDNIDLEVQVEPDNFERQTSANADKKEQQQGQETCHNYSDSIFDKGRSFFGAIGHGKNNEEADNPGKQKVSKDRENAGQNSSGIIHNKCDDENEGSQTQEINQQAQQFSGSWLAKSQEENNPDQSDNVLADQPGQTNFGLNLKIPAFADLQKAKQEAEIDNAKNLNILSAIINYFKNLFETCCRCHIGNFNYLVVILIFWFAINCLTYVVFINFMPLWLLERGLTIQHLSEIYENMGYFNLIMTIVFPAWEFVKSYLKIQTSLSLLYIFYIFQFFLLSFNLASSLMAVYAPITENLIWIKLTYLLFLNIPVLLMISFELYLEIFRLTMGSQVLLGMMFLFPNLVYAGNGSTVISMLFYSCGLQILNLPNLVYLKWRETTPKPVLIATPTPPKPEILKTPAKERRKRLQMRSEKNGLFCFKPLR